MSYASRTNLALGGAIVSAILAQTFPQFTVAWLLLGGLSSLVAIHAMFSKPTVSVGLEVESMQGSETNLIDSRTNAAVEQQRQEIDFETLDLSVYRALMEQKAALQRHYDKSNGLVWSSLTSRMESVIAANVHFALQRGNVELMEAARIAPLNSVELPGSVLIKRHVRSSMLDERVANWIRSIDEHDHLIDLKPASGTKKRGGVRSFVVPDFCGSASVH